MSARKFACALLLGGAAAIGIGSSAYSFTLSDDPSVTGTLNNPIYYGASNTYTGQDVIGNSTFYILDAVINRTTTNAANDTLNVRIDTNYAGAPGTKAADGTNYGSLFLNPLVWNVTGSAATHYSTDNFANAAPNSNQNWAYAVTTDPTGPGTSGLYATGLAASGPSGAGSPTLVHSVAKSYTTADGTIIMSNVNGDPVTYPGSGNPGYYFRQGQLVQFDPTTGTVNYNGPTSVTFTVGSGYIDYSIVDNGLLGNTFALAWAMTCANDAIQGLVQLSNTDLQPTPLPAALPLFATGLGCIGLMALLRRRKNFAATA